MQNIILAIYYTDKIDPQRNKYQKKNNIAYIKKFYDSIIANKMKAVIFHDSLTPDNIIKYQNEYVEFQEIPNLTYGLTSMNDIRFMIYLEYLHKHPNIDKVIISDASDVYFNCNIFDDIRDTKLYVCCDRNRDFNHYYLKNRIILTYGSLQPYDKFMYKKALQAGLFGGNRDIIIQCLESMKWEFDNMVNKNNNSNYIVFNHVVYDKFISNICITKTGNDMVTKCGNEILSLTWKYDNI